MIKIFYKLADRIQVIVLDDQRVFLVDDGIMELEGCTKGQVKVLQLLKQGYPEEKICKLLSDSERKELFSFLNEQNLLRRNFTNEFEGEIVEKQIYFLDDFGSNPNQLQKNLSEVTVVVLGVGGIGSVVLQHLVSAGVQKFILIDGDIVQKSNLNRQFLYCQSDVGRKKVEAARDRLLQINPNCEVNTFGIFVDSQDSLQMLKDFSIDFLINAADQPFNLSRIINNFCIKHRIPWISAGVGRYSGTWGPLLVPFQTVCMNCFERDEEERMGQLEKRLRRLCTASLQASFGPTNTVISALLAKDVILYLAIKHEPTSFGRRCIVDFEKFQLETSESTVQKTCDCWKGGTTERNARAYLRD
ncbi:ThiF family adenylyltransferase [Thermoactinomyces mirandus]|uniref:ThiF family adenylyltransferase n=1 Tax=Thermoactinomyces mirandus TaxID=2756294 RepID=A0A7W1XPF2_9BACL|nr:ThiF family adenylyltransferase [Thermoactinomyces mirandus]MBA4600858.1 ThiF family adenylyltransferase [Thermoactinomyces mirandus]